MNEQQSSTAAAELSPQKNGMPARTIVVPTEGSSNRPAPGYFGRIEPANPDEILATLYPAAPEIGG